MHANDTIFATSSAPGPGWRGILRLSGPEAWPLALALIQEKISAPAAGHIFNVTLHIGALPAMLLLMKSPRSFTGEDVAELHVPGSPALLRLLEQTLAEAGGRGAMPGEFTARAFFHGKMDLTQAEGIAATIAAENHRQLRAAMQLRDGTLHTWTAATADILANLLALVEAGIDFSDEEGVSFISPQEVRTKIAELRGRVQSLVSGATRWERLDGLPTVALLGKPNVGKSSLINALSQSERAIVSSEAGTTRDGLTCIMTYPGTAGIRLMDVPGEEESSGEMAAKMNATRTRAAAEADLVLHVSAAGSGTLTRPESVDAWIINKIDLAEPGERAAWRADALVSTKTLEGVDDLRALIVKLLSGREAIGHERITLNRRHRTHLDATSEILARAAENATDDFVRHFPELLATDLRHALDAIGQISGTIAPDEILGRIFGSFCIGK